MGVDIGKLNEFVNFASKLKGDEKGEAQIFLDRLFIAFGHKGVIEADATLEHRIKIESKTKFCDLLWPGRVLIEMKKRGEDLNKHFSQAKAYFDNTYANRPKYVILCNFDDFWIYDWNKQRDPVDFVKTTELKDRWEALTFLCPEEIEPIFKYNYVNVTKDAADKIALLYNSLVSRKIDPIIAQRFVLQCLVALFADHTGLFPREGFFVNLIKTCIDYPNIVTTYEHFNALFQKMNDKESQNGGKFKGVPYFDGGIFSKIYQVELTKQELEILYTASLCDWSKVQPSIFGNIFEDSLSEKTRHTTGSHFTYESDIMRIVEPTILRPWRERINSAKSLSELLKIKEELANFKILDPACGSGNFLFVSFRELKHLELDLFEKILNYESMKAERLHSGINGHNFYGIDKQPFAVELAKVTLSMAKKFAADDFNKFMTIKLGYTQQRFLDEKEEPLPFDNLDDNFIAGDSLFIDWPDVNAIIGNPPFQSKNKMQEEFGTAYLNQLREKYPNMPGKADYCVYWFRKAQDTLHFGGRAGLVGTNTISQTNSREGGLDYILSNNGAIVEAVASMPWSGSAVVHVSIVNWVKGIDISNVKKKLAIQKGEKKDGPWKEYELDTIPSSLTNTTDVTQAIDLAVNKDSKVCYQGQTHGNEGFLLTQEQYEKLIKSEPETKEVLFPYLIADELVGSIDSKPERYVIDYQPRDIYQAQKYKNTFKILEEKVLQARLTAYEKEKLRNSIARLNNPKARVNRHHEGFYKRWWLLSYGREDLINKLKTVNRYIACSRVTRRPIFEFISSNIRPNDALQVFTLNDDYSFGILQSSLHWEWFKARCSTFKDDYRYTSETIFDSFPWPQWGDLKFDDDKTTQNKKAPLDIAKNIAKAAQELRTERSKIRLESHLSLRDMYRTLELPGVNSLKEAHNKLDNAVRDAYNYGLPKSMKDLDTLEFLLKLNGLCANAESSGQQIIGPGLPTFCKNQLEFFSDDCIRL